MDYLKIYNDLINDAKNNPKIEQYKESHHIIPKCLGGKKSKSNLVKLTARQHFIAHWLLYKIYKTSSLAHAWNCMSRVSVGQEKRLINSHGFKYARENRNKILSINSMGPKNHFYGKKHKEETKLILSRLNKGKDTRTKEQLLNWIEKVAKKKSSDLQKATVSERNKNFTTIQNKITHEKLYIKKKDISLYDPNIWVNPKKINPEKKEKCLYCDMFTTKSNLSRWHNEKCKRKIQ